MQRTDSINLKICLINAENLFLLFDSELPAGYQDLSEAQWQQLSNSVYENKPLRKCKELARSLQELDPDIILVCEVGGEESLKNFNHYFMNQAYLAALIEGNSDRNIDVGFLIKKNLPFFFDIHTNKNRPINYLYPHERTSLQNGYPVKGGKITSSHKFSRDCAELHLFTKNQEEPFFIILLTHLKSRLDPERIDPQGFERRQAELLAALEIFSELKAKHSEIPIMLAGDFNGNAAKLNTDNEFLPLYQQTELEDVLEISQVATQDRATFYQVRSGTRTDGKQIDFCFIEKRFSRLLSGKTFVHRYKNALNLAYDIPTTLDEKLMLPSDHYPIFCELTLSLKN